MVGQPEDPLVMGMYVGVANLADEPGLHHQRERPIDRPPTHAAGSAGEVLGDLVGTKMVAAPKHMLQHDTAGVGDPRTIGAKKSHELCPRTLSIYDRSAPGHLAFSTARCPGAVCGPQTAPVRSN